VSECVCGMSDFDVPFSCSEVDHSLPQVVVQIMRRFHTNVLVDAFAIKIN
jgi:hypothetical protein